ncbi:trypsin-like serine protease, partial [Vibrio sp. 10N.261.45.F1]
MKKTSIAITLSLLSSSAFAITNGTNVDWKNNFDDMVKNNCTGMVVGGDQVLTAAHCIDLTGITFTDGTVTTASRRDDHPNYLYSSSGSQYDVSMWTLPHVAKTQNIHYFADLNTQNIAVGDSLKAYGFGGRNPLAYAEVVIGKLSSVSDVAFEGTATLGEIINGDSGGVWMKNEQVIAITEASSHSRLSRGTDLHQAKDFILDRVNGWHYQTVLKGTGTKTVKVQSLHKNSVVDAAYTNGDVTITGGTCKTKTTINAFDTCTYTLDVKGTGKLHLTSNEVVDIN